MINVVKEVNDKLFDENQVKDIKVSVYELSDVTVEEIYREVHLVINDVENGNVEIVEISDWQTRQYVV